MRRSQHVKPSSPTHRAASSKEGSRRAGAADTGRRLAFCQTSSGARLTCLPPITPSLATGPPGRDQNAAGPSAGPLIPSTSLSNSSPGRTMRSQLRAELLSSLPVDMGSMHELRVGRAVRLALRRGRRGGGRLLCRSAGGAGRRPALRRLRCEGPDEHRRVGPSGLGTFMACALTPTATDAPPLRCSRSRQRPRLHAAHANNGPKKPQLRIDL